MPASTSVRSGRAAPLPPGERRAAIVAAALPLVAEHGRDVTTRQIAEAAGIAEGTIFRAFPDKAAVIDAVIASAFDAGPTLELLAAVDADLPLRDRVVLVVEILRSRLDQVWRLMSALRLFGPPPGRRETRPGQADDGVRLDAAIARVLRGSSAQLRTTPESAARAIRLFAFSATHPRITDGRPLTSPEVADLILDGIRVHAV